MDSLTYLALSKLDSNLLLLLLATHRNVKNVVRVIVIVESRSNPIAVSEQPFDYIIIVGRGPC